MMEVFLLVKLEHLLIFLYGLRKIRFNIQHLVANKIFLILFKIMQKRVKISESCEISSMDEPNEGTHSNPTLLRATQLSKKPPL